jgi:arylsulfatase A-like enzyme
VAALSVLLPDLRWDPWLLFALALSAFVLCLFTSRWLPWFGDEPNSLLGAHAAATNGSPSGGRARPVGFTIMELMVIIARKFQGSSRCRQGWRPLSLILVLAALLVAPVAARQEPSPAASSPVVPSVKEPNVVLILTDDQDVRSVEAMPVVQSLLHDQGAHFTHLFASTPLCCPARASILRGQYAHNHGVLGNEPPNGGFVIFRHLGLEDSTVATWLQAAGYRTALLGKYLNGYSEGADPAYVPPGWDEWYALVGGGPDFYVDYELNENGRIVAYGSEPADYLTDVLSAKATDFVERTTAAGRPFFLYLAPYAAHAPVTSAPRHAKALAEAQAPHLPAFNEADVSDKPGWVQDQPLLTDEQVARIDVLYRNRLRTLLAVDEMVGALVATLTATGTLDNTYIVFTSDNGFHLGEHRLPRNKKTPYEAASRVPLLVRGPGVPAGLGVDSLALIGDLAPTIADLAGVPVPPFIDSRSLAPLLRGGTPITWRGAVLLENFGEIGGRRETPSATPMARNSMEEGVAEESAVNAVPAYRAMRTANLLYVEYVTGERELYDLRVDPYELDNVAGDVDSALLEEVSRRLTALAACAAATCRAAEDAQLDWAP